jgi:hypothetical protein
LYYVLTKKSGFPDANCKIENGLARRHILVAEVGTETFQAQAIVAEEPERTRLYVEMVEVIPGFEGYHHTKRFRGHAFHETVLISHHPKSTSKRKQ